MTYVQAPNCVTPQKPTIYVVLRLRNWYSYPGSECGIPTTPGSPYYFAFKDLPRSAYKSPPCKSALTEPVHLGVLGELTKLQDHVRIAFYIR